MTEASHQGFAAVRASIQSQASPQLSMPRWEVPVKMLLFVGLVTFALAFPLVCLVNAANVPHNVGIAAFVVGLMDVVGIIAGTIFLLKQRGEFGKFIMGLGIVGLVIGYFAMGGQPPSVLDREQIEKQTTDTMNTIENKVAQDAADEYHIANRQGDKMQICVQAGLVAAAFLQAKNEASYNLWKGIEASDCARAGVPR